MGIKENLKQIKEGVHFGTATKADIRKRLIHMIDAGSVRAGDFERHYITQRSIASIFKRIKLMPIYAVILVVALLGGGGVSAAAQGSLPGDTFYPVKVGFNEKVGAAFRVSEDSRANYEVRLMERRLEEAEEVAAKGDLDAEVKTQIEENFEAHADRVEDRIADFEAKEDFAPAADIALKFHASLEAHGQILVKLAEQAEAAPAADIAVAVRTRAEAAEESRVTLEERVFADTDTAAEMRFKAYAEGLRTDALASIRTAAEYLEAHRAAFTDEVAVKVQMQLRASKNLGEEGTLRLNKGEYRVAANFFQQARQIAEGMIVFMRAEVAFTSEGAIELGTDFRTRVVPPVDIVPLPPVRIDADADSEESMEFKIEEEHGEFFLDTKSLGGSSGSGSSIAPMPVPVDSDGGDIREIEVKGDELEIKGVDGSKVEIKL
ncbi:MAG: DUF5667 domain-containing protein [Patescibacteria group bacterium]